MSVLWCLQYFSPYLSADMTMMASAFNTTVSALEEELMQLILDGQINARIDSHNKVRNACDSHTHADQLSHLSPPSPCVG